MKLLLTYGAIHFFTLIGLTLRFTYKRLSLYNILDTIATKNILHLLHSTFFMYLIILSATFCIRDTMGGLRLQEHATLSDNLYMYLIDSMLVLSVFSNDINYPNLIIFVIIVSLKCIVWVLNVRTESDSEESYTWFSFNMFTLSLLLCFIFIMCSLKSFSIAALFAFELGLIALSHLRNIFTSFLHRADDSNRPMYKFYIDITHLACALCVYGVFIIVTTIKYKIPLNVFRSAVAVMERLVKKVRVFIKYCLLCKDLDRCEDIRSDALCPICHDELGVGKVLRCKHVFHLECLKSWCERQSFCPICKTDIRLVVREVLFINDDDIINGVPVSLTD